jgi:hypothetical protein
MVFQSLPSYIILGSKVCGTSAASTLQICAVAALLLWLIVGK